MVPASIWIWFRVRAALTRDIEDGMEVSVGSDEQLDPTETSAPGHHSL